MTKHKLWIVVWAVVLFGGITGAQVSTGTISGTVKDSSGAVLPGAKVVILNERTGISRTVETDENGHYSALSLSLGDYTMRVTRDGFQTEVRNGIVLTVAREEVVDLSLTVGAVTQTVVVTGGAPLVETNTAALGSLVDDQTIRALPLNGRSWEQLALVQPGVVRTNTPAVAGLGFSYGAGTGFSVGGMRATANLFLLDGMVINDQTNATPGGAAGLNLGVDTILEFKIFTDSFKAEYGHSMGSVTTAVTRSGTNQLHGTAFEYIRNHVLDASNFFDVGHTPPPFIRNQFGGVLGGPIKKDKLFFFGGYEGLRQGLGTTLIATVPTALARQGMLPTGNVTVDPVVVPYLNLYPLPNGHDFGNGAAQFLSSPTIVTNEDNAMGRVDYQLNDKTGIFGRYTFDRDSVNAPQSLPFQTSINQDRRQYITLQATTVLSTKAVNAFRFGYQRSASDTATTYTSAVTPELSFIPGEPMGSIQLGAIGQSTGSTLLTSIGPTQGNGPFSWHFNLFQWADDLSYIVGKHSLKVGLDIERVQNNLTTAQAQWGVYTFSTFTNFLLAKPSNLQAAAPLGFPFQVGERQTLFAFYAQDDYKVNSRLTLNLGLRWEATTPPYDAGGKTVILPSRASTNTVPWPTYFTYPKNSYEPRFGLAWVLNGSGKTVLRSGAGIYHNQILPYFYNAGGFRLPPYGGIFSVTNPAFPNGTEGLKPSTSPLSLLVFNPNLKIPTAYEYNLSLQQQISKNTMVQVAYAGNRAIHLTTEIEGDSPIPTICSTTLANCPAGVPDGAPYFPAGAPRRNPAWSGMRYYQSNGDSEYNSGTVMVRHQSSSGFVAQAYYTFAWGMDDTDGISPAENQRSPQSIMNELNYRQDWGPSGYTPKHALVGYFTYPLPFRIDSKALGTIVNGWQLNSMVTVSSGLPFTALLSTSNSRNLSTAGIADRPNLKPGFSSNPTHGVSAGCPGFAAGTPVGKAKNWYDPCAFSLPIPGTYGDLGRNTLIGPGIANLDVALQKNFPLTERLNATFRAEAFNIINHANFGLPNTSALTANGQANPAAGNITTTLTSSRQLQFALRINF